MNNKNRLLAWLLLVTGATALVTVVSLFVLRLPNPWNWLIPLVFPVSFNVVGFLANILGIRSALLREQPPRYFMTLDEYLTRPGPRFPKTSDFEEDLVYLPEKHVFAMKRLLREMNRCLLVGRSASGKTVLAIALAKQLQETKDYETLYANAARAQEGDGRAWYEAMCTNDREGVLYILDNCHLAPDEVNEFCFQWEGTPPKHAQAILISRLHTGELEAESTEIGNYFDMWADVIIEVQPEEIYRGIIEKYATAYHHQDPSRYVALEEDDASLHEVQHAHNLVASRSRLEAWREDGGRLSEVTQEAVYEALARKYLSLAREALAALCVLWQYEIPAHSLFVERELSAVEVRRLEEENLLDRLIVPGYGVLYELVFHPEEAREIFEASIYRRWGHVDVSHVEAETVRSLRAYLRTKPPNYVSVYHRLYRHEENAIQRQLSRDRDLQACATSQFEMGRISDTALYLYNLSKMDSARAQKLLGEFVRASGIDNIRSRLLKSTLGDIQFSLHCVKNIDAGLTREILAGIHPRQLAAKARESRFQGLFWLVRTLKGISPEQAKKLLESIPVQTLAAKATASDLGSVRMILVYLQELDYPSSQMKLLVKSMDMEQLAQKAETQSLQSLYWLVRALKDVSPKQAKTLLESIPVQTLAAKAIASDFGSVERILVYLQELDYPTARLKTLVESLGLEQLVQQAETQSLQRVYWFIRALKNVAPATANGLLQTITPAGLASRCRSQEATAQTIMNLCNVSTKSFRRRFLRQFSSQDVAGIFDRSPLGQVGTFIQYRHPFLKDSYALFKEQCLTEKLAKESLDEIGKFIHRIGQAPRVGDELACEVLDVLATVDLSERIASTDLEQFALLLHNAKSVNEVYALQLLAPLSRPEIVRTAVEKSGVRGISWLIHHVASIEERYLQDIRQALYVSGLTDKLAAADVGDLGYLLWGVFVHIDQSLSRDYCKIIDKQQRSKQLREASLNDLCHFLWNLTQISDLPKLQTLDDPIVKDRLVAAWDSEVGLGAELLGIIATTQPEICEDVQLPPIETEAQKEHLVAWLAQTVERQSPYILALTVRGLRAHNESEAQAVVRNWFPILEAAEVLEDAIDSAITPQALALLQQTHEWLSVALFEETIEWLDELQEAAERLLGSPTNPDIDGEI